MEKTEPRYKVLEALADQKVVDAYAIATDTQIKIGEVHTHLLFFEERGIVESRKHSLTNPAETFYRLTPSGVEPLEEYQAHFGPTEKLGLLTQVKNQLLTATDQVRSRFFHCPVPRAERNREP